MGEKGVETFPFTLASAPSGDVVSLERSWARNNEIGSLANNSFGG